MKIKLVLKDPDGVWESVKAAAEQHVDSVSCVGKDSEVCREMMETAREAIEEAIKPWVTWGEYITIEIDTATHTARVLKANEY